MNQQWEIQIGQCVVGAQCVGTYHENAENITSLIIKWRLTKFFSAVVEGSTQDFNQAELCTYLYIKLVHSHMKPAPVLDISIDGCRIWTLAGKSRQKIVKEVAAMKIEGSMGQN